MAHTQQHLTGEPVHGGQGGPSPTGSSRSCRATTSAARGPRATNDRWGCPLRRVPGCVRSDSTTAPIVLVGVHTGS